MAIVLSVIKLTVSLLLDVLQFMMFARAIVSWLPNLAETALGEFLFTVTEWIIMPVRVLFDKFGWNANFIFDIPFMVTFLILSVVGIIF